MTNLPEGAALGDVVGERPGSRTLRRVRIAVGVLLGLTLLVSLAALTQSSWLHVLGRHVLLPIQPMGASHLEVRVEDRRLPIIDGRELQSVSFTSDFLTVYVQPGSSGERYLHASAYGAVDATATLFVDGKPVATGFVAGDMNVDDTLMGPEPGETGFFYLGTDYYSVGQQIVDQELLLPLLGLGTAVAALLAAAYLVWPAHGKRDQA